MRREKNGAASGAATPRPRPRVLGLPIFWPGRKRRGGPAADRAGTTAPLELVLYTRAACPLCERMRRAALRARVSRPFRLRVVDVDRDPDLRRRFGEEVPVLELAGVRLLDARADKAQLERAFAQAFERAVARR